MSSDVNSMLDKKIVFPNTLTYFLVAGFLLGTATFIYSLNSGHQDTAWAAFHSVSYTHLTLPTNREV